MINRNIVQHIEQPGDDYFTLKTMRMQEGMNSMVKKLHVSNNVNMVALLKQKSKWNYTKTNIINISYYHHFVVHPPMQKKKQCLYINDNHQKHVVDNT